MRSLLLLSAAITLPLKPLAVLVAANESPQWLMQAALSLMAMVAWADCSKTM